MLFRQNIIYPAKCGQGLQLLQYASVLAKDGWKLVAYRGNKYELYNIYNDIGEENNLAENNLVKRDELVKVLRDWERSSELLIE